MAVIEIGVMQEIPKRGGIFSPNFRVDVPS
jgi:hypothetical protein